MDITGQIIRIGGVLSLSVGTTVSMFLLMKIWRFFGTIEQAKEEFEELWKEESKEIPFDDDLLTLSHIHRAVRKQLDELEKIDKEALERAINQAEQNKGILTANRSRHLYYAASEKLQEVKRDAKRKGVL
ncbi:MAG: hypothetical protein ACLFTQ_03290 [Candidatus Aenigmatarchaeota archaeon]